MIADPKFDAWLKSHGCTTEELWKLQNCLGTVLGFDHPEAVAAKRAWQARSGGIDVVKVLLGGEES